ncbi:hypothetical protein PAPYR_9419 [Paratrimastix pyriformis]|uniref:Uncharacterized protein n=1 Tax=Paratrimastix pyriformis TaxID=342808 RepID=A0ABQ8UD94_9EUKA|nr:hypothetical protein PAPYR_9419 [Paratrimastix pyriformis]
MSSETHSVEDAGAVPLTLESVEAEANRQRMEAAGKKRVAEKSQAEEQGEKKEKVMAETMRFAIKFEPSAVQFSWYELECQLREILARPVFNKAWKKELWRDVRNQAVLTDLGERPASAVTFVTMRAHLGGLPLEAKEEEVRQWLREANPSAQFWVKPARQPGAWRVCDMLGGTAPHPGDLPGQAHSTIAWEDRPPGGPSFGFIRAAGVEWPQQMEYLKNHHIVVEVSDIWRSEVAWSSGRWDGTFCVMATPEQREAIDALKRESPDVSLSPGWTECFASEVGPVWCRKYLPNFRYLAPEMPKLLGMWPLILVGLVKGNGSSNACICTKLRRNGQLWTMSEGLVVTLGPRFLRVLEEGPLCCRRDALGIVTLGWPERVEDNLAKMWQANLTEWYEENPEGDNLKKEENPAVGDNLKKEENPAVGDNLKKEENRRRGQPQGAALGDIGWVGMEDHAGDGNASQAGDIGGILLWLRWLGLASFCLRALGTGRFGKETGSDIMDE